MTFQPSNVGRRRPRWRKCLENDAPLVMRKPAVLGALGWSNSTLLENLSGEVPQAASRHAGFEEGPPGNLARVPAMRPSATATRYRDWISFGGISAGERNGSQSRGRAAGDSETVRQWSSATATSI